MDEIWSILGKHGGSEISMYRSNTVFSSVWLYYLFSLSMQVEALHLWSSVPETQVNLKLAI